MAWAPAPSEVSAAMKASWRDLDPADHLHPLLALLLLLEQLALAGDVAAVALGEHVLADGADGLAGDDPGADGGLDRHLELLPRDQLLELAGHHHAVGVRLVLVHDRGERVDRLALQQDVDLDQVGGLLAGGLVVERGVALGARLQLVEEVEDDLGERQRVAHLDPVLGEVVHAEQGAALGLAELHDRADVVARREDRGPHHGLADLGDLAVGELARVGHDDLGAVLHHHLVDHVGRGRDQVEVELALEPLADDLHVQQAEEAAAEAEAERPGGLRLVGQRGVVELELVERVAQVG